jgi:hypothetical protein
MSIRVNAENIAVPNPVRLVLEDSSAAHVILTASITGHPPFVHEFTYGEGRVTANLTPLPPGEYRCAFTVQAFRYGALGAMYSCSLYVNGMKVAAASGNVSDAGFESGSGQFKLTVH